MIKENLLKEVSSQELEKCVGGITLAKIKYDENEKIKKVEAGRAVSAIVTSYAVTTIAGGVVTVAGLFSGLAIGIVKSIKGIKNSK